jgi:hypothetical protein
MKDFIRDYWKIAAAFAAGAFLLSLLVGLFTRNPFGVVILRALLLTVIFAGFGAGLRFVVRRYLPEIGAGETAGADRGQPEGRGTKIDITLPEERPEGMRGPRESGGRAPGAAAPAGASRNGPEADSEAEAVLQAETAALDELAEELAEELPAASDSARAEDEETTAGGHDGQGGEAEELRPLGRSGQKTSKMTEADSEGEGNLDSLPDISNLEVAGEQGSGSPQGRSGRWSGGETPEDSMRGAVSGQDPATIARAIRTVLKRDEKG